LEQTIGVFALQGDFHKHKIAVEKLGHKVVLVKDSASLEKCSKLIIPGGESTTFLKLVDKLEMRAPLLKFAKEHAVMGTCAGLIILAAKVDDFELQPLGLIDITVERNAYGRQIDSFIDTVTLNMTGEESSFEGVFIRAPKIVSMGENIRSLGVHNGEVIMAASENILVATFHPELTDDLAVHRYFVDEFDT
jgi:5'-phosphate synthase pdxT subunit